MYTLYTHPFSQHGRRVVALLESTDIAYETKIINLGEAEHLSPGYLKVNPNHQVPTLVEGDISIHESGAILRWLCAKHDLTDWYPTDLTQRAKVEQWLDWTQCKMLRPVIDIVLNRVFMGDNANQVEIKRGLKTMAELTPILEDALDGQTWIAGGTHPSIADLALASNITQLGLAKETPSTPHITAWYKRVCALPGFAKCLPEMMMA